jgi:hypothetical protein
MIIFICFVFINDKQKTLFIGGIRHAAAFKGDFKAESCEE